MEKDYIIHNKIYNIQYTVYKTPFETTIYVQHFSINPEFQNKHKNYSKRIFNGLLKKYNATMMFLECNIELISFYKKCGFIKWSQSYNSWGGVEMHLYNESI